MEKTCDGCNSKQKSQFYQEISNYLNKKSKLNTYDWLNDITLNSEKEKPIEVRFKNTHKSFFKNTEGLDLEPGDVVTVETDQGHDIGIVSLTGELAKRQFDRKIRSKDQFKWYKIYRKADKKDISRWKKAKEREYPILIRTRQIIKELNLDMKLSDVEMQGDGSKATFYYIADDRVDFRKLIKQLAREFSLRIEMKQIGSRQEAGMIGSIGSCGRELCCASWRNDFESIKMDQAKDQNLPLNSHKLAGQCGKLKCCLIYELDHYLETWRDFPGKMIEIDTSEGIFYPHKYDFIKKEVCYSKSSDSIENQISLSFDKIKEILKLNNKGKKPNIRDDINDSLKDFKFSSGISELYNKKTTRKDKDRKKRKHRSKKKYKQ